MLLEIRRRLSCEDGLSLIEMLVAVTIIVVALFALLSAMLASVRSVGDQRDRSVATRLANERHEELRGDGYDAVTSGTVARTVGGRTYTLATVVTTEPAAPGSLAVPSGSPDVKQVITTVRWRTAAAERSAVYETAIRPSAVTSVAGHSAGSAKSIKSVSTVPNPAAVGADGRPVEPVEVTVVLSGFDDQAVIALSWANAGGDTKTKNLISHDGGITWNGTLAAPGDVGGDIVVAPGASGLDLTLRAGTLTRAHTLVLTSGGSAGPVIDAVDVDPQIIVVARRTGSCTKGQQRCNTNQVTASATVSNLDPARDSVRLTYTLADGTVQDVAMVHDPVSGVWRAVFPAGSTQFKQGTHAFTIVALIAAGGVSSSASVTREVVAG